MLDGLVSSPLFLRFPFADLEAGGVPLADDEVGFEGVVSVGSSFGVSFFTATGGVRAMSSSCTQTRKPPLQKIHNKSDIYEVI